MVRGVFLNQKQYLQEIEMLIELSLLLILRVELGIEIASYIEVVLNVEIMRTNMVSFQRGFGKRDRRRSIRERINQII